MFTDDTTLITKQKNLEAIWIEFFVKINNLAKFFSQNSLKLNLVKTKLVVTKTLQEHNESSSGAPVICIGDDELDITKSQNSWGWYWTIESAGQSSWLKRPQARCRRILLFIDALVLVSRGDHAPKHVSRKGCCTLGVSLQKPPAAEKCLHHCQVGSHISYLTCFWGSKEAIFNKIFILRKKHKDLVETASPVSW